MMEWDELRSRARRIESSLGKVYFFIAVHDSGMSHRF